jgi:hypothetical protein
MGLTSTFWKQKLKEALGNFFIMQYTRYYTRVAAVNQAQAKEQKL